MPDQLFSIPATITSIKSMSGRALRIVADSQEALTDEEMASVMKLLEAFGHWMFLAGDRQIDTADVLNLPPLKTREEDEKSPATRLRAVLFRLYEQSGKDGDFEQFYYSKMNKFIEAVKDKLN